MRSTLLVALCLIVAAIGIAQAQPTTLHGWTFDANPPIAVEGELHCEDAGVSRCEGLRTAGSEKLGDYFGEYLEPPRRNIDQVLQCPLGFVTRSQQAKQCGHRNP